MPVSVSIAAMIDGDVASIEWFSQFIAELRQHGRIVESKFFAAPCRVKNPRWNSFLESNSTNLIPVARSSNPLRDPNDDAIYAEVRKVLQAHKIGAIALLVGDTDYTSLVEEIVAAGKRCFVSVIRNRPGTAMCFKRSGAQLICAGDPDSLQPPKHLCVLHRDGSGSVQERTQPHEPATEEDSKVASWTMAKLLKLDYRSSIHDPMLPSIAKFWFDNGLGDLIVFPTIYAGRSVAKLLREQAEARWVSGRQDLAFVLPRVPTSSTQRITEAYGGSACAERVRGGGPFLLRNSPTLVELILQRMGFIDKCTDDCIEEAVDVFASLQMNAREIRKSGFEIGNCGRTREKIEMIRKVCLSSSFSGSLQKPPSDSNVRAHLVAHGVLKRRSAPTATVFRAMESYVRFAGLAPKKTYSGRVLQCLNVYASRLHDPCRRQ